MDLFSIEKTNVTGNPAILNDSAKMALQGLTVYGRSNQTKTTGAQLLDLNNMPLMTNTGATVSRLDDGGFIINGTPAKQYEQYICVPIKLDAGTYYISGGENKNSGVYAQIAINKAGSTIDWAYNRSFTVDGTETSLVFIMQTGSYTSNIDNYRIYPMLNKGTTALPWEPYTGGKPSPSPDYPQDIKNAKSEVVVRGKNLIPVDYSEHLISYDKKNGQWKFDAMPTRANVRIVDPNKITWTLPRGLYTMTMCDEENVNTIYISDATEKEWVALASVKYTKKQSTFSINKEFAKLGIYLLPIDTAKPGRVRLQLEYSSEGTDYEPYHEPQTLTITSPTSLPGIPVSSDGNYTDDTGQQWICDEVDLERGVYVQRVYSVIVDGVNVTFSQAGQYCNMNLRKLPSAKTFSGMSQMAETRSTFISETWNFNPEMGFLYLIKENYAETINESCKEHSGEVMYALETPIETPLTDSDIATYNSIRTYDGTTVVRATDDVGLSVTYGRKINMANTTLKTRIILNNKTTDEWAQAATFVGLKGEFLVDSSTRKIKIGDGATAYPDLPFVNLTPEEVDSLIKAASHSHSNKDVLDATTASFTTALLEKLNGIATGANKTVVDDALSNTSVNPVQNKAVKAALDGKVPTSRKVNGKALTGDITLSADDVKAIPSSQKGVANGVASLDENGKVPAAQLPSYVDDVLEGYVADDLSAFYKDSGKTSAYTPETGKIYVNLNNNKTYRYSGSKYAVISETLALGETSSTAFDGARGKKAYDHSQSAHAPSNAERNIIVGIQKNGADVAPDGSRKVNITVPTKTSQITNDSGFITSGATTAKAKQLETARKIDGVNFDGTTDITHYGTCSTAAGTAAKTVAVTGFNLVTGARVTVKFTVTNTAASPTLNVNGTGAKAIKYRDSTISTGYLAANRVYEFVYDGTDYLFMGDINTDTNTTYKAGTGITIGSGNAINHTNSVTAGTVKGDDSKTLGFGGTFKVPSITYDAQGHITSTSTTTMTMPATPTTVSGNAGSATKLATARNFSITGGATASAISFNGTADVALNVTSLNAAKLTIASSDTLILDGTI